MSSSACLPRHEPASPFSVCHGPPGMPVLPSLPACLPRLSLPALACPFGLSLSLLLVRSWGEPPALGRVESPLSAIQRGEVEGIMAQQPHHQPGHRGMPASLSPRAIGKSWAQWDNGIPGYSAICPITVIWAFG